MDRSKLLQKDHVMAPPRKDPKILEASGAYAKNPNRRPVDMPKYIPGAPDMPPIVAENEQAKWYWNWCCQVLDDAGVLTTACLPLLTMHALDWAAAMRLFAATKNNVSAKSANGNLVSSPEAKQLHAFVNRLLKELAEFGLTPASKSRIVAAGKQKPDSFSELLARRMAPKAN